jgi:hypothetical protein
LAANRDFASLRCGTQLKRATATGQKAYNPSILPMVRIVRASTIEFRNRDAGRMNGRFFRRIAA